MNLESMEAGDPVLPGGETGPPTMDHSDLPMDESDKPADGIDHSIMDHSNTDMNPTDETDGNAGVHHDQ